MKVIVLKRTRNELKIEIEGAGHTLCNLIQKKLLEDGAVDVAGYDIPHPLVSNPIIYVRTKGETMPEEALLRALNEILKIGEEFGKELERALKT